MPNPAEHVDLARVVTPRDDSLSGEGRFCLSLIITFALDHPFPGHLLHHYGILLHDNTISKPHIPPACFLHGNGFVMDGGVSEGHGEARGCHRRRASGRALVLYAETGTRG